MVGSPSLPRPLASSSTRPSLPHFALPSPSLDLFSSRRRPHPRRKPGLRRAQVSERTGVCPSSPQIHPRFHRRAQGPVDEGEIGWRDVESERRKGRPEREQRCVSPHPLPRCVHRRRDGTVSTKASLRVELEKLSSHLPKYLFANLLRSVSAPAPHARVRQLTPPVPTTEILRRDDAHALHPVLDDEIGRAQRRRVLVEAL